MHLRIPAYEAGEIAASQLCREAPPSARVQRSGMKEWKINECRNTKIKEGKAERTAAGIPQKSSRATVPPAFYTTIVSKQKGHFKTFRYIFSLQPP